MLSNYYSIKPSGTTENQEIVGLNPILGQETKRAKLTVLSGWEGHSVSLLSITVTPTNWMHPSDYARVALSSEGLITCVIINDRNYTASVQIQHMMTNLN